jgi:hypothetical protein
MIRGIDKQPYINLDQFLDIDGMKELHPEICKGFATARDFAKEGTWMSPGFSFDDASYIVDWKPIYKAFNEWQQLPNSHPLKIEGNKILPTDFKDYKQRNVFTRFLKAAMGANDPYIYYFLWEEGDWDARNNVRAPTEIQEHFPGVVAWVNNLVDQNIISQIGRVIFFHCDHNGKAFEHRDLDGKNGNEQGYSEHRNEFIHIRNRTKRGFYIWDPETQDKHYINSHAAFWNDQDWHGGESSKEVEYGLRIDCVFTDKFRIKLELDHINRY